MPTSPNLLDLPILRALPAGHDEPQSPYYIKPDHRDAFQRAEVTHRETADMVEAMKRQLVRDADFAIWEATRAQKEAALDPNTYRAWLVRHTYSDGRPNLVTVSEMSGATMYGRDARALDAEQTALAEFYAVRDSGARLVDSYRVQLAEHERRLLSNTCGICGTYVESGTRDVANSQGNSTRGCSTCIEAVRLIRILSATTESGVSRLEAVQAFLDAGSQNLESRSGRSLRAWIRKD